MLIRLIAALLLTTLPSVYAFAESVNSQEQPQGDLPLAFESLTGSIILNNGSAPKAELILTVSNAADDAYHGTVRFADSEMMALEVPGNDSITLTLTPKVRHAGKVDQLQKALPELYIKKNNYITRV